ncbi:MAG: DNA polymerase Y family protein [Candidatus Sericytochromatia bacterium]|nr:DNA polymerase Y family protein [Candidatus Sericytochromatia bacterium]
MARMACVEVPSLALQLLLREQPGWRQHPVALVEADRPLAPILEVNARARAAGLRPGERYGTALDRLPALRAGVVAPAALAEAEQAMREALAAFSPTLEPHPGSPGVCWLDAGGLGYLHPSLEAWAEAARTAMQGQGLQAGVVVGFRRFATWALVRTLRGEGVTVLATPEAERAALAEVPIEALALPPAERDALQQLGVSRLAELLALPPAGLAQRFGPAVREAWRLATDEEALPLQPRRPPEAFAEQLAWPHGERDLGRLVFALKPAVDKLLARLAARGLGLAALRLVPRDADGLAVGEELLRPATPALSSTSVMELVRLRLEARAWHAPAFGFTLEAEPGPLAEGQLEAWSRAPRRDPAAAARAFARLRAAFGEAAVGCARLVDRHTPEHMWRWEPLAQLPAAAPTRPTAPTLARVLLPRPRRLQGPAPPPGLLGWAPLGAEGGVVVRASGPFRLTGGWWRHPLGRDYHYVALADGRLLWIFENTRRGGWFLQATLA